MLVVRADGPDKTLKDSGRRGEGEARHDQLRLVGRLRHPARGDGDLRRGGGHQAVPHSLSGRRTGGGGAALGRQIDALASGPSAAIGQIKAGKMRALASWGDKRLASMPDVPSMKELGYDATFYIWSGLFAPAATPQPPVLLRDAVRRTVEDPEFKDAMAKVETPISLSRRARTSRPSLDRDAERLRTAVERIGKVPETKSGFLRHRVGRWRRLTDGGVSSRRAARSPLRPLRGTPPLPRAPRRGGSMKPTTRKAGAAFRSRPGSACRAPPPGRASSLAGEHRAGARPDRSVRGGP